MICRRILWLLLRAALAVVFLYAGVVKLADPASLASSIVRFQLVPLFLVHPIALALPPLEVICGIALLAGPWKRQAAFGLAAMCAVFLVALLSAAIRGLDVDCTCFGSAAAQPIWWLILRDVVLLAAAGAVYLHQVRGDTGDLNAADDCRLSSPAMKSAQL
ncbi:MAG: MauE/DoxX family redox-associated membrane protein [Chthoniobacteraceae bacterium]